MDESGSSLSDVKEILNKLKKAFKTHFSRYKNLTKTNYYKMGKSIKSINKTVFKVNKKMENMRDDIYYHARDVVNLGFWDNKNVPGYYCVIKNSFGMNETKYVAECRNAYYLLWAHVYGTFNIDITYKGWPNLTNTVKLEILNTIGGWSPKIALNIGKYYSFSVSTTILFNANYFK